MNLPITNPAPLDLSNGIPLELWKGADEPTRRLLLDQYNRHRTALAHAHAAAARERQLAIARIVTPKVDAVTTDTQAQLARVQSLLTEAAAAIGALAAFLRDANRAPPDTGA